VEFLLPLDHSTSLPLLVAGPRRATLASSLPLPGLAVGGIDVPRQSMIAQGHDLRCAVCAEGIASLAPFLALPRGRQGNVFATF